MREYEQLVTGQDRIEKKVDHVDARVTGLTIGVVAGLSFLGGIVALQCYVIYLLVDSMQSAGLRLGGF